MFVSSDPGPEPPGGPTSLLWTNRAAGSLHFPRVTEARPRHCAAHRPADTATQHARGLPLGQRVDIYSRKLHGELQGVDISLVTSHSRIQKPVQSTPLYVSNNKRNNEAVKRCMTLPGPTTMRTTAFIPRLVPLNFLLRITTYVIWRRKKKRKKDVWWGTDIKIKNNTNLKHTKKPIC